MELMVRSFRLIVLLLLIRMQGACQSFYKGFLVNSLKVKVSIMENFRSRYLAP